MVKFIVFEGIDGCGKTTTISRLKQELYLLNYNVILHNDIQDPFFEQMAKYGKHNITNEESAYIWWAARKIELRKLEEKLKNEYIDFILVDRYYHSTCVYQKLNKDQNLYNHNFDNNVFRKPDLVFYLKINSETYFKRKFELEKDIYETHDLQIINDRIETYDNIINDFEANETIICDNLSEDQVFKTCLNKILNL